MRFNPATVADPILTVLEYLIQHFDPVPESEVAEIYCRMQELIVIPPAPLAVVFVMSMRGNTVEVALYCIREHPKRLMRPAPEVLTSWTPAVVKG
jgi:hypothetical protein